MPKRPYTGNYRKRRTGEGADTKLPTVGQTPQGNYDQKTRYPKSGSKNSRPNSRK